MAAALAAALALSAAGGAGGSSVVLRDTVASGGSTEVTITVRRAAAFSVLLRVPTAGRGKLLLLGRKAPKGGPLIDTKTYGCEGAAGSWYCKASYEPLPAGRYTWRITWVGTPPARAAVTLTVRW